MVKIILDGRKLEVEPGTTILKAARAVDVDIPTFCYQDRLSISASCRMCLVEIEGRPKLEPACATAVAEDMVIHSRSPKVVTTREDMLEILLANHPLDCPVCDKGGECELQDTVYEYGRGDSRLRDRKRVFREKDIELNQVIVFNANRCIQCQRCVRVCEEIVGDVALGTAERGLDSEITGTGNSLKDCSHCGNCIEVCPVGALMSIPYRYKARPWDLQHTETICGMCGTGCSLTAETRDGEFKRVKSRFDTGLNRELLCAKGRFGFDAIDGGTRIAEPMIREGGTLQPASWETAVAVIAEKVRGARRDGLSIAGQVSARQTNETAFLFQRLLREVFGSAQIRSGTRFSGLQSPHAIAALTHVAGELMSRQPVEEVLKADCIFVLGANVTEENPVTGYLIRETAGKTGAALLVASSRPCGLDGAADAHMRLLPGSEARLLSQLTGAAETPDDSAMGRFTAAAAAKLAKADSIALLVGTEFLRTAPAAATLQWISAFADYSAGQGKEIRMQFLFDRPNQLGVWDMGCLPGVLPGWVPAGAAGAPDAGAAGVTYVLGGDPGRLASDAGCKIVHASHMSEAAGQADVLLPAPSYGEEGGSFTCNDGRVQQVRPVRDCPPPVQVFKMIAEALGQELQPQSAAEISAARATAVPAQKLPGAASAAGKDPARPAATAGPALTGRRRYLLTGDALFHSGRLSARSTCLTGLSGGPYAELNPGTDAAAAAPGARARITRNGQSFSLPLKINPEFDETIVFVPEYHLNQQGGAQIAGADYPAVVTVEFDSQGS